MKRIYLITVLAFALLAFLGAPASAQDVAGYACETCPTNWLNLIINDNNCGGPDQSPIAFSTKDAQGRDNAKLKIFYGQQSMVPEYTDTNIEWGDEGEDNTIKIGGEEYDFKQFHFHTTAEHVINGERSDLEMHFVNKTDEGNAVVLAVSIMTGAANDAFLPITDSDDPDETTVDLRALLPESTRSFRYVGSTTTPPCSGGVQWNLFKEHVELSNDQIDQIRGWIWGLNDGFDNNRPIQNREGRWITNAK